MKTMNIPLEWVNRASLRLRMEGGVPSVLHVGGIDIPPEGYVVMEDIGEIALFADPPGEIVEAQVEVEDEAPPATEAFGHAYGTGEE